MQRLEMYVDLNVPSAIRLSVRLSVPPGLGAQRLCQATRAVRTADPSAHGRRSAAIGGGISSRRAITCVWRIVCAKYIKVRRPLALRLSF